MDWERLDHPRIERALREMAMRTRFCVSGDLRMLVVKAMWDYVDRQRTPQAPTYTIDAWSPVTGGMLEQIAQCQDGGVAAAAYEAAVRQRPGVRITLRNGIRVVRSTDRDRTKQETEAS